jgi:hypothetical protein
VGPVGTGVAGCVGFTAGRSEWSGAAAVTEWALALANGNVCTNVAAIRYPPSTATTAPPAISPSLRPDHEPLGPPEAIWAGGQDCPDAGPAGGQDCGGTPAGGQDCGGAPAGGQDCGAAPPGFQGCAGGDGSGWAGGGCGDCQNWPGGRCGTCPAGGQDCGPAPWMPAAPPAGDMAPAADD